MWKKTCKFKFRSEDVTIDLSEIFDENIINISKVTEMQLTGTKPLEDVERLRWKYRDGQSGKDLWTPSQLKSTLDGGKGTVVTLKSRDIGTFLV